MTAGTPAPQDAETVDEARFAWHDVTCPEGPECRSRHAHATLDANARLLVDTILRAGFTPPSARAREVEAARREAWDEGKNAGAADAAQIIGWGVKGAPDAERPEVSVNPYRDLTATHAETEES